MASTTAANETTLFEALLAEIVRLSVFISNLSFEPVMHYATLSCRSAYNKVDISPSHSPLPAKAGLITRCRVLIKPGIEFR